MYKECTDHWHCDPATAAHGCKQDRTAPCPQCGSVVRYVITHVSDAGGLRVLTFSRQGRDTFDTQEQAEEAMRVFEPGLRARSLGDRADTLEVRPVECWHHHDPKTSIFPDKL